MNNSLDQFQSEEPDKYNLFDGLRSAAQHFPLIHVTELHNLEKQLVRHCRVSQLSQAPILSGSQGLAVGIEQCKAMRLFCEEKSTQSIHLVDLLLGIELQSQPTDLYLVVLWATFYLDMFNQQEHDLEIILAQMTKNSNSPVQLAGGLFFLCLRHTDVSDILKSGMLHRFFERNCFSAEDLKLVNYAYDLFEEIMDDFTPAKTLFTALSNRYAVPTRGCEAYGFDGKKIGRDIRIDGLNHPFLEYDPIIKQTVPVTNYYEFAQQQLSYITSNGSTIPIQLYDPKRLEVIIQAHCAHPEPGTRLKLSYSELVSGIIDNSDHYPENLPPLISQPRIGKLTLSTPNVLKMFQLFGAPMLMWILEHYDELAEPCISMLRAQMLDNIASLYHANTTYSHALFACINQLISTNKIQQLFALSVTSGKISPWVVLAFSSELKSQYTPEDALAFIRSTRLTPDMIPVSIYLTEHPTFAPFSEELGQLILTLYMSHPALLKDTLLTEDSGSLLNKICGWLSQLPTLRREILVLQNQLRKKLQQKIIAALPLTKDSYQDVCDLLNEQQIIMTFLRMCSPYLNYPYTLHYQLTTWLLLITCDYDHSLVACLDVLCPIEKYTIYDNPKREQIKAQCRMLYETLNHLVNINMMQEKSMKIIQSTLTHFIIFAPSSLSFDIVRTSPNVHTVLRLCLTQMKPYLLVKLCQAVDATENDPILLRETIGQLLSTTQKHLLLLSQQISPWLWLVAWLDYTDRFGVQHSVALKDMLPRQVERLFALLKNWPSSNEELLIAHYLCLKPEFEECKAHIFELMLDRFSANDAMSEQLLMLLHDYPHVSGWCIDAREILTMRLTTLIDSEYYPLSPARYTALRKIYRTEYQPALQRLQQLEPYNPSYEDVPSLSKSREFRAFVAKHPKTLPQLAHISPSAPLKNAYQQHGLLGKRRANRSALPDASPKRAFSAGYNS